MNIIGSLRFAFRGVNANKLRSLLTTLGILIGVAAVIVLLSVGTGSSAAVKKSIARLGTETLTVDRHEPDTRTSLQQPRRNNADIGSAFSAGQER